MVVEQNFRVIGTGSCLPSRPLSAEDVDVRTGMESGWTRANLGVITRYECVKPETLVDMGRRALEAALDDAALCWKEIDYIVDCSTCKFRPIPCNAVHYQQAVGAEAAGIPGVDIDSTCLGFILAIHFVNGLFAAGACRHVVIVASESGLQGVNWSDPASAGLFGDGAAAMVLRRETQGKPLGFAHESFAEHLELCTIDGGAHHLPPYKFEPALEADYRFQMDGPGLFRVARKRLPPMVERLQAQWRTACQTSRRGDMPPGECRHGDRPLQVIPHQASPKAVEFVRRLLRLPKEHYHVAVEELGNMVAASIPTMIDRTRRSGQIQRGDQVMLLGTSAGYSQAAILFEL